ncbi:MAG: lipoprotein [Nitrosomonas sp.]|nr:lipoprotein [Nitrosomonas sp.]
MRLPMRSLFIPAVAVTLVLLAACGNKGPLYIPDTEMPAVSMTPTTPPAAATMKDENEK